MLKLRYSLQSFLSSCVKVGSVILLLSGCATTDKTTLYQQLGEQEGIKVLVENFINEILVDPKLAPAFEEADLDRTHDKLIEQICQLANGPCEYTGKSMVDVHKDMVITKGHFNAAVEALMRAMDSSNIPVAAQNQLLALLAPMHEDIITAK